MRFYIIIYTAVLSLLAAAQYNCSEYPTGLPDCAWSAESVRVGDFFQDGIGLSFKTSSCPHGPNERCKCGAVMSALTRPPQIIACFGENSDGTGIDSDDHLAFCVSERCGAGYNESELRFVNPPNLPFDPLFPVPFYNETTLEYELDSAIELSWTFDDDAQPVFGYTSTTRLLTLVRLRKRYEYEDLLPGGFAAGLDSVSAEEIPIVLPGLDNRPDQSFNYIVAIPNGLSNASNLTDYVFLFSMTWTPRSDTNGTKGWRTANSEFFKIVPKSTNTLAPSDEETSTSQTSPPTTSESSPSPSEASVPAEPSSLGPGAIAGIAVGGVSVFAIIVIFVIWRRRSSKKAKLGPLLPDDGYLKAELGDTSLPPPPPKTELDGTSAVYMKDGGLIHEKETLLHRAELPGDPGNRPEMEGEAISGCAAKPPSINRV